MSDGSIVIDTRIDNTGLEKGVNSLGKVAKTGLKVVTGAMVAAGTALTGLGIASIKVASDLTEVQNVVDVTFGQGASIIDEWAKSAATAFGMSELQAKKFNGTMGAMLKSMGLADNEVLDMSTSMVGLAGDFASFYNLGHEEAFDKIRAGISGETEPLKQLGINMSVANLEAFALSQGINTAWKEMSQAEQAILRYNYILKAGADAQGDFARTSDSLANQTKIAQLNMQSLSADIGNLLLPVAKEAVGNFNNVAEALRESFKSEEMQASILKIAGGIGELVKSTAEFVIEWLPKIIDGLAWMMDNSNEITSGIIAISTAMLAMKGLSVLATVLPVIIGLVSTLFLELATAPTILAGISGAIALLGGPVTIVIGLVAALVAGIVYLWNTNEGFRTFITECWNSILAAGETCWGWLVKFFTEDIPAAFNIVMEWFGKLPEWFGELWIKVCEKFTEWGTNVSNFFNETIPKWIEDIKVWFSEIPYNLGVMVGEFLTTIYKWGSDTWTYFETNIPLWIEGISKWFSELPGKIWTWLVEAYNNVVKWGSDMWNKATEIASTFLTNIINWFRELPGQVWTWLTNTISKAIQFGNDMKAKAIEAGQKFATGLIDILTALPGQVWDIGVNIVEGLWNGITSMGSWISNKVSSFFSGIVDGAKSVLGIHSPSRVFRDQVGKYMAQGVGVGFENETENIQGDMQANLTDLTAKMTATVNYETAGTSRGLVASTTNNIVNNNNQGVNSDVLQALINAVSDNLDRPIQTELNIDGNAVASAVFKPISNLLANSSKKVR